MSPAEVYESKSCHKGTATPHRYLVNYSPNWDTVLVLCAALTHLEVSHDTSSPWIFIFLWEHSFFLFIFFLLLSVEQPACCSFVCVCVCPLVNTPTRTPRSKFAENLNGSGFTKIELPFCQVTCGISTEQIIWFFIPAPDSLADL